MIRSLRSLISSRFGQVRFNATASNPRNQALLEPCFQQDFDSPSNSLAKEYRFIRPVPVTSTLGAEISGIDLSEKISSSVAHEIQRAMYEFGVIFFRDQQEISYDQHLFLAELFGEPEPHPIVSGIRGYNNIVEIVKEENSETRFGETWHSDNSFMEKPSFGSVLIGRQVPEFGNDTLFACMNAAYDGLSDGMKDMLHNMHAIHTAKYAFSMTGNRIENFSGESTMKYETSSILNKEFAHPVIRTHDITGKKSLYVNSMFTTRFDGMSVDESEPLLQYLYQIPNRPELQCRFRWAPGSVAMWDNCRVQHIAVNDNKKDRRVMHRVTVKGEKPM